MYVDVLSWVWPGSLVVDKEIVHRRRSNIAMWVNNVREMGTGMTTFMLPINTTGTFMFDKLKEDLYIRVRGLFIYTFFCTNEWN